ncbi:MAG: Stk1 family PASTA domain-containing Ser/Thr kinase [Bacillota bacterium]
MIDKVLNERYKIIEEIGKGGMAIVYEGRDLLLDRKVAIKILRSEHLTDKNFLEKFQHEARAVARISHPNVVSIFDIGQDNDYHYLVMEFIEGENLKDIISQRGQLSAAEALDITRQICSALEVAHKQNVIHCDIKPHNIILDTQKTIKVTDFGIARAVSESTLTMTDTIMGSAHYFSPEQAKGGEIKGYSDLYSVGVVLFEMLTGEVPFSGESPISVALKHIQKKPRIPSAVEEELPRELKELVLKALAKEPEDRFDSATQMKEKINEVMKNLSSKDKREQKEEDRTQDTKIMKKEDIINKKNEEQKAKTDNSQPENGEQKKKKKTDNTVRQENRVNTRKEKVNSQKGSKFTVFIKQNRRTLIIVGIIILLLFSGTLYLYNLYLNYTDVPTVEVPELNGQTLDTARRRAAQKGLEINVENEVFHEEAEEGEIVRQNPAAGSIIKQSRDIQLTVSKGPPEVEMPDLEGLSEREAVIELENIGLENANLEYVYNEEFDQGYILSQEPEPGETISTNEEVNIEISDGPQPDMVEVPDVVGLNRNEAVERLTENNLEIGEISTEKSKRYLTGEIMEQEVEPGSEKPEGSDIDVIVSGGILNENDDPVHSQVVRMTVTGFEKQEVIIEVEDENGVDTAYRKEHSPGDNIEKKINSVGPTTYRIYVDDSLIHEESIDE